MTEVQDPIKILDGMRQIALADMMDDIGYISPRVVRPERRDAICRGHKACAVGSAWLAAGVRPRWFPGSTTRVYLPGVEQGSDRNRFLSRRPALRRAFDALNEAAAEYTITHSIVPIDYYSAPVEALFESEDPKLNRRRAMLSVIASAKRKVKAEAAK